VSRSSTAIAVLLVTPPGATEEALRAALTSMAGVEILGVVAGCLSAAQCVNRLAPDFVVISGQIPAEEIVTLIGQLADGRDAPRAVVLSSSHVLEQQFLAAGASAVLAPWEPVERLGALIHAAVSRPAGDKG
jgi:AmiR/NasT family two-component response regulator